MSRFLQRYCQALSANWFVVLAVGIISIDLTIVGLAGWSRERRFELALLLDLAVIISLLCVVFYWSKPKTALIRAVSLACLAVWLLGFFIPTDAKVLLPQLIWVRYGGLVLLGLLEAKIIIVFLQAVFSNDVQACRHAAAQANELGMPAWIAKLVAIETRFWQRLRSILGRR